ncbi:phage tail tape measure protein [Schauerella aestuarii]|uniref:phage tail tape measure protein n=1 Tax=Schauerella aestuarii TaxID=2511204 RepID=UPI0013681FB4|nr:phage tail tape measure protein [Achromobacter aestuarii]MYZ44219.1 phage tail tape measure protein [Achromobacter aestuarii]
MTNVAGKTVLQVGVDGTQATAGIDGIKKSVQDLNKTVDKTAQSSSASFKVLGQASDDAGNRISAAGRRTLKALENEANRVGLTKGEYAQLRAEKAGVANAAAPFVARITAASTATASLGMSAKATAAAMRGVPAQLTDIVVGLQGGQAPLTVLLQQGGQLKDMFGGVVPAAKALGSSLLGLINPYTLAATAVAGVTYAYYSGTQEAAKFSKALIESGNFAGQTVTSLQTLAASVATSTGVTQSQAAEIATAAVSTGQITGAMIETVTTAAAQLEKTGGQAVEKTIEQFIALGKEPAQASAALNQQYNYLTVAVYDQIVALQKQGDTQGAVKLAMTTYADTVANRTKDVQENLGFIERGWNAVKNATLGAVDAAKGIGRGSVDPLGDQIRTAQEAISQIEARQAGGAGLNADGAARLSRARDNLAMLIEQRDTQKAIVALDARSVEEEKRKIAARQELARLDDSIASKEQQRAKSAREIRRIGAANGLSEKEINDRIALSDDKYKDPKTATPKAYRDSAAATMLLQLKEQEASLRAQADGEKKITDASKDRAKFEQQIADLKEKKILTADQKSLLANQDAIRAQLDRNVAISAEVKQREALIKLEERAAQIQASMTSSQASRQEQYDRTLSAYGQGDRTRQRVQSETGIRREYQRYLDQLNKSAKDGLINSDKYAEASKAIADGQEVALQAQREFYEQEDQLRGSWQLGFENAFQNYSDSAADAYKSAGNIFGTVFGGMEDQLTSFISKGKVDFKSFADSIISDLARVYARQAISGLAGMLGQAFGGAAASSAASTSAYQPGSDGFIPTLDISGGRAIGGPVSSGSMYRVNENGSPELAKVGSKQYLMMGNQSGSVTPLKALTGSSSQQAAPQVEFNLINQSSQPLQAKGGDMRFDGRRMIQDVFIVDMKTNGPMARAMKGAMG